MGLHWQESKVMKFLNRQNRYAQLVRSSPAVAEKLQGELQVPVVVIVAFSEFKWIQSMPGLLERTSLSVARESRSGAFKGSSFTEGQRSCLEQGTYCTLFKTWITGHSSKYWFYKMPFSSCRKICLNTEVFIVVRHTLLWFSEESMFQQCW